MTEFEKDVIDDLIKNDFVKHYMRFVDDTLMLMKPENIPFVLNKFNSFNNNLQFTVDTFDNEDVHFLDIKIDGTTTDIYYKPTHTGQYSDFSSQTPWNFKISWVKSLINRAHKICSNQSLFKQQIKIVRQYLSWNGYPSHISNCIIKRQTEKLNLPLVTDDENSDDDITKIFVNVPYLGLDGERLVKSLIRKLGRYVKPDVKFITRYQSKKLAMFCPTKDKVLTEHKAKIIYEIVCPGCGERYVGKTDRCFKTRMIEHGKRVDQPMNHHLNNCSSFHDLTDMYNLAQLFGESQGINHKEHILKAVLNNCKILDSNDNWSQLAFLEEFYIKKLRPKINDGLKASKELQLFG
ncbi:uncharacterized protein [Clytia hemisphaerica]|uniref:uncharacterized protein n=1 Tax=Clytia hemisphaerica TaxID=252671 RepID=UPI0034D5939F